MPEGLRHVDHARGNLVRPAPRRRARHRWAATGPRDEPVQGLLQRTGQRRVEVHGPGQGLLGERHRAALERGDLLRLPVDLFHQHARSPRRPGGGRPARDRRERRSRWCRRGPVPAVRRWPGRRPAHARPRGPDHEICAAATMGSARSTISVVPAWLPWPETLIRQRPWPRMELPTATAGPRPAGSVFLGFSPRPCSTCSSMKSPIRAQRLVVPAHERRVQPVGRATSAKVLPCASRRFSALAGSIAPVSSREPRHATPKREPSSSGKTVDGQRPVAAAGRRWPRVLQARRRRRARMPRPAARRRRRRRAPSPGASR